MDTKQAITEKQGLVDEMEMQLMSSAPESIPCVVELRDELNTLYDEVSLVLDKKMDMQNSVEVYRMMLQDFFTWLDTLIKRAENADKGRGNTIAQRVSLLEQLTAETSQGKPKLAALTTKVILAPSVEIEFDVNCFYSQQKAGEISEILSTLDGQQVEEQLKVAERRFGDVERRLHRKLHLLQTTHQGAESATVDIALIRQWVAEKTALVREKEPLGFRAKSAETKLQQTKVDYSFRKI